jgi:hypothetical protein
MAGEVIQFPTARAPHADEAQSLTLVAALDATLAIRLGNIEAAHQQMLKQWDALQAWADASEVA